MRVNDFYVSYQGSGALTGERQFFIRLAGCKQKCPLRAVCDESIALSPDSFSSFDESVHNPTDWWHFTGGEPAEQQSDIYRFLEGRFDKGRKKTHIQTSGLVGLSREFSWTTVSPKSRVGSLKVTSGEEMIVVYDPSWVNEETLDEFIQCTSFDHYFLMPMYASDHVSNVKETLELNKRCNWRLTFQVHKLIGFP